MQFDSLAFVVFFVAVAVLYWSTSKWAHRKNLLLIASYLFYAGWNPLFLPLLMATSLLDWRLAHKVHAAETPLGRKIWLWTIIVVNLSVLGYFKYFNFFAENLESWGLLGGEFRSSIALPIGISFYTFHSLSYCIDVFRGTITPTRSLRDYLLYVAFFPQLVAGPIVRWRTMGQQIEQKRDFSLEHLGMGLSLMVVGLFQKTVLADGIFAPAADQFFIQETFSSPIEAWMGALAFTGQIFSDFAGYTTCALGAAWVLGFQLPLNFQAPYAARGFSDFWQRWHISLSSWLRDYLYIALGGNRLGWLKTGRNLIVTMCLGGLWHGAAWTFVVWGLLHGAYLLVERAAMGFASQLDGLPSVLRATLAWGATFAAVVTAWVFFRAPDIAAAIKIVSVMYQPMAFRWSDLLASSFETVVAVLCLSLIVLQQLLLRDQSLYSLLRGLPWPVHGIFLGLQLLLISLTSGTGHAFIYFQF